MKSRGLLVMLGASVVVAGVVWGYYWKTGILSSSSIPAVDGQKAVAAEVAAAIAQVGEPRALDIDALAARMQKDQGLYRQLRDETLAVYTKRHPGHTGYEKQAQQAIRISAYLWVWGGDYYGEGLWHELVRNATPATTHTDCDPLLDSMLNIEWYDHGNHRPGVPSTMRELANAANRLDSTDYPTAFKLWTFGVTLMAAGEAAHSSKSDVTLSAAARECAPALASKAAHVFDSLVKAGLSGELLYRKADQLIDYAQYGDGSVLMSLYTDIDRSLAGQAQDGVLRGTLKGTFYINYAWNARGSGWADTVTDEGWRLFTERLEKADDALEEAYQKFPDAWMIPRNMITVELGQGKGRDRMEMWFTRAQKDDPDNFSVLEAKLNYLKPRWHGSPEDLWQFGLECAKSPGGEPRKPLILLDAACDLATENPGLYANPAIWIPVVKVFRAYLQKYPLAVTYRSRFAQCAVQGGHWQVAQEQFKILGDDWDPSVFSKTEYVEMTQAVAEHIKPDATVK